MVKTDIKFVFIFIVVGILIITATLFFIEIKYNRQKQENTNPVNVNESSVSPFGVAFGEGYNQEQFMSYIHDIGVNRTKIYLKWDWIEPSPGVYDWSKVDAYVNQLNPGDKALLNIFTNGWGTNEKIDESYKGATFKNETCKELYREFIVELVKRTNGKITYWQRDTEPASKNHYPSNKPEEYVETQKIFYEAVKSVQPDAIVVGVNANGDFNEQGEHSSASFFNYIINHMEPYYDVLDIRLYEDLYDIPYRVSWFRDRMHYYGYDKPIICTEFGGPDPRTLDAYQNLKGVIGENCSNDIDPEQCITDWFKENYDTVDPRLKIFSSNATAEEEAKYNRIQSHDIIQRHIMAYSAGVEATWWWNLQSAGKHIIFGKMRLMDSTVTPWLKLNAYYCFQRMVNKLHNLSSIHRISLDDNGTYFFRVNRYNETEMYVIWHRADGVDCYDAEDAPPVIVNLSIDFSNVTITNVFGDESTESTVNGILTLNIDDTPLYIEKSK